MRNKSFFGQKTKIGYRDDFKNDLKKILFWSCHTKYRISKRKKNKQPKKDWKEILFLSENEKNATKFSFS